MTAIDSEHPVDALGGRRDYAAHDHRLPRGVQRGQCRGVATTSRTPSATPDLARQLLTFVARLSCTS